MQSIVAFKKKEKNMPTPTTCAPGLRKFQVTCSSCNLRELCLPDSLTADEMQRIENLVYARRKVKRGETLFRAGDAFHSVYAIRVGFFKTGLLHDDGREQDHGAAGPRSPKGGDRCAAPQTFHACFPRGGDPCAAQLALATRP